MHLCAINTFTGDKKNRVHKQYELIKRIIETNPNNHLDIIDKNFEKIDLDIYDSVVTCGDVKIIDPDSRIKFYRIIKSHKTSQLVRDVTFIRQIPNITKLDVNNYPRFTWNSSLVNNNNFPYDKTYNRWLELRKRYNLTIKDYKKEGDKILFILQIPGDTSVNELNFNGDGYLNFAIRTVKKILDNTDRNIVLRGHPLNVSEEKILPHLLSIYKETKRVFKSTNIRLNEDLEEAKCVISYNSSSTVEALINGIKVINISNNQPCFDAASKNIEDIENLKELDRENFFKKISFLHWENQEFESKDIRLYFASLIEKSMPGNKN